MLRPHGLYVAVSEEFRFHGFSLLRGRLIQGDVCIAVALLFKQFRSKKLSFSCYNLTSRVLNILICQGHTESLGLRTLVLRPKSPERPA